jgi:DNA-directed RNA polymerase specialized sigma subunit
MDDREQLLNWQKSRDPDEFVKLYIRYQPVVGSVVNKFKTTGLPQATIRAQANSQLIKAMETYNGNKETQPITHIFNSLLKVQRTANESLMSGHIPEARNMKRATFNIVKENLTDTLGREPSIDELSDELKFDKRETVRMLEETSKGETSASHAPFDFYGSSTKTQHPDRILIEFMHSELPEKQKIILEHTVPYFGKEQLNNKEIAKRLKTNEMYIGREKRKMAEKIKSYR